MGIANFTYSVSRNTWSLSFKGNKPRFDINGNTISYCDASDHLNIYHLTENKNIRIGSRTLTSAAGHTTIQIKPRAGITQTGGICGLELSPGINAGFGGTDLIALKADPLLKAGTGNLSGKVAAIECNIDFGTSGTRTITGDVSAFETFLAIPSTYTYSAYVSVLRVRSVNIRGWDCLFNFDDANVGLFGSEQTGGTALFAQCRVGTTLYSIKLDKAS